MIPNLVKVDDSFWRGGQPANDDDWNALKKMGVTRIIKLNTEADGTDVPGEALGMEMIYCPIPVAEQIVFRPDYWLVKKAVDAIAPGCLVHCSHGQDRTGLAIGCWRVWRCGWTKEDARKEMDAHGFHWELLGLELFWDYAVWAPWAP